MRMLPNALAYASAKKGAEQQHFCWIVDVFKYGGSFFPPGMEYIWRGEECLGRSLSEECTTVRKESRARTEDKTAQVCFRHGYGATSPGRQICISTRHFVFPCDALVGAAGKKKTTTVLLRFENEPRMFGS